jgi:hypothetical protein
MREEQRLIQVAVKVDVGEILHILSVELFGLLRQLLDFLQKFRRCLSIFSV